MPLLARARNRFRALAALAATAGLAAGLGLAQAGPAQALDYGSLQLDQATSVGIHNTYDNSSYPYLADALDAGATLIELDAYVNPFTHQWDVSHSDPIASDNNCSYAPTTAGLYSGKTSQDLDSCLGDIATWLSVHPTANPIMIKLELKEGFDQTIGMGPAELDSYINAHIGSQYVYKPVDLLTKPDGTQYPNLDAAAKADNWPTRQQLQGKAIIEVIPGTVEEANPFDHLWTDTEYADYISGLDASGQIANAEIFPSVLGAQSGDPRTRYPAAIQPWFVVFDGDAATYVADGNTEWYNANHYLVIATDAENVAPTLSDTDPSLSDAQARVAELAADSVSWVSTDWSDSPGDGVLPEVLPRG